MRTTATTTTTRGAHPPSRTPSGTPRLSSVARAKTRGAVTCSRGRRSSSARGAQALWSRPPGEATTRAPLLDSSRPRCACGGRSGRPSPRSAAASTSLAVRSRCPPRSAARRRSRRLSLSAASTAARRRCSCSLLARDSPISSTHWQRGQPRRPLPLARSARCASGARWKRRPHATRCDRCGPCASCSRAVTPRWPSCSARRRGLGSAPLARTTKRLLACQRRVCHVASPRRCSRRRATSPLRCTSREVPRWLLEPRIAFWPSGAAEAVTVRPAQQHRPRRRRRHRCHPRRSHTRGRRRRRRTSSSRYLGACAPPLTSTRWPSASTGQPLRRLGARRCRATTTAMPAAACLRA
mmetsp:Transcript_11886/g.41675  ORF Transcript_11886/g.41675 Transcript_11886/m.41675 type:complete len:353 (+) Transcript_11886:1460-2518(+)